MAFTKRDSPRYTRDYSLLLAKKSQRQDSGLELMKKKQISGELDNFRSRSYVDKLLRRLNRAYPEAVCSLRFTNPLELLVATILSAQCTDKRVNQVTESLFVEFPTAGSYALCPLDTLENAIRSTGFYRNKAKHIRAACAILESDFCSQVPSDMDQLVELPGVGRKTANVILGTAFGVAEGVVVDTHVGRISRRTGLTEKKNPEGVERDLMAILPKNEWIGFSHRLIKLGRGPCKARRTECDTCPLSDICPRIGVNQS